MREISILLKGMNPSSDTKEKIEKTFEAIQYILPPESDIKLVLKKYSKNFEGTVIVRSPMGDFTASDEHKDLIPLIKALKNTLKNQIFKFRGTKVELRKAS